LQCARGRARARHGVPSLPLNTMELNAARFFYAPFELHEDKSVTFGARAPVPARLAIRSGFM